MGLDISVGSLTRYCGGFTAKPAWDGYSSLILWAAYLEHPDLGATP
jgi:hypothetical protein